MNPSAAGQISVEQCLRSRAIPAPLASGFTGNSTRGANRRARVRANSVSGRCSQRGANRSLDRSAEQVEGKCSENLRFYRDVYFQFDGWQNLPRCASGARLIARRTAVLASRFFGRWSLVFRLTKNNLTRSSAEVRSTNLSKIPSDSIKTRTFRRPSLPISLRRFIS